MQKTLFGKLSANEEIYSYRLENSEIYAEIITYGAIIKSFGRIGSHNVVGSFDTLEDYLADNSFQGAIIGRVANRIENARFTIDGIEYNLTKNNGENCLHGGEGFNTKLWTVETATNTSLTLSYYSADGESGFPGGLKVLVTYSLIESALVIDYKAYPEKKTPIALTNHAYFNLLGMGGNIYSHEMCIYADRYTAVNDSLVPTGKHPLVEGTEFDFRTPRLIGEAIEGGFRGYDHNFKLCPTEFKKFLGKELGLAVKASAGGLTMLAYTDMRDLLLFTSNGITKNAPDFAGGVKRIAHGAFCLEAQTEPNAVNRGQTIYGNGEVYTQTTVYELIEN